MTNRKERQINLKIKSIVVFKKLFEDDVMKAFIEMIDFKEKSIEYKIEKYSNFASKLFRRNENFTQYIWQLIIANENFYVDKIAKKENISKMLKECVRHELEILQEISQISSLGIKEEIGYDIFLPDWEISKEYNFYEMYRERMDNLFTLGYGIYCNNIMFTYSNAEIVPVKNPDNIRLENQISLYSTLG